VIARLGQRVVVMMVMMSHVQLGKGSQSRSSGYHVPSLAKKIPVMLLDWWRRRRLRRILAHSPLTDALWRRLRRELPLLHGLTAAEAVRLRELSTLFLHEKRFTAVQGLALDDHKRAMIAAQACLLILGLDFDRFDGWVEIVVYPAGFKVTRQVVDEAGVVHEEEAPLIGEAWERGPVILAWTDVERDSLHLHEGRHVVIHEFAHKLDALNGRANGMPPLHPEMSIEAWSEALSRAYQRLVRQVEQGHHCINPYAATNPAEFFAVVSEYFFTAPHRLRHLCPEVYDQLRAWYRQDPRTRIDRR